MKPVKNTQDGFYSTTAVEEAIRATEAAMLDCFNVDFCEARYEQRRRHFLEYYGRAGRESRWDRRSI